VNYIKIGKLDIAESLHKLVSDKICPGTNVSADHFFTELEAIIRDFGPRISLNYSRS